MTGRFPVKRQRLGEILRDAIAIGIEDGEIVLSVGQALVGSETKPLYGFQWALRHTAAGVVRDPKIVLRFGKSALGSKPGRLPSSPHGPICYLSLTGGQKSS